jgi:type IV secretory pathway TrbL component
MEWQFAWWMVPLVVAFVGLALFLERARAWAAANPRMIRLLGLAAAAIGLLVAVGFLVPMLNRGVIGECKVSLQNCIRVLADP